MVSTLEEESGGREDGVGEYIQSGANAVAGKLGTESALDALDLADLIQVARRVGCKATTGMSDQEVLVWLAEKPGRLRMLGGHLHEWLDAKDLKVLSRVAPSHFRELVLYKAHNRPGLDGAYRLAVKGDPRFATHKFSDGGLVLKGAAVKVPGKLRGQTEVVVARGQGETARKAVGSMRVREAGRSLDDVQSIVAKAADPDKVLHAGAQAAKKMSAATAGKAGAIGACLNLAWNANAVRQGDKAVVDAAEDAGWAAVESAAGAYAAAGATAASAAYVAAGTTALAASSVGGTTAAAAGLALLGPVGVGIGASLAVGIGVRKLRQAVRG